MTALNLSNPESLEVLTSMLNQTLIETGRFFRSGGTLQSRTQLKRAIPVAHEQFQCALDSLSEQIFIAKAFLERDYEMVQAKKAALRPVEDVDMDAAEAVLPSEQTAEGTALTEDESKATDGGDSANQHAGLNNEPKGTVNTVKEEKEQDSAVAPAPTQTTAGTEEINFDSILNNQGPNEFDLNLDFGDDNDTGNENFLSGANFNNLNTGTGMDGGNAVDGSASGHNTSAMTGGDAFDLELQKAEAFSAQAGNSDGQFGTNMEDIMGPGESSFDDLFMESENLGGDGAGDPGLLEGDGLMQINELDDSWFT